MKYGQYRYVMNIASAFSTCFIIGMIIWIISAFIVWVAVYCETNSYKEWIKISIKWTFIILLATAAIIFACGLVWFLTTTYIPYKASPEIWSITEALELIKS